MFSVISSLETISNWYWSFLSSCRPGFRPGFGSFQQQFPSSSCVLYILTLYRLSRHDSSSSQPSPVLHHSLLCNLPCSSLLHTSVICGVRLHNHSHSPSALPRCSFKPPSRPLTVVHLILFHSPLHRSVNCPSRPTSGVQCDLPLSPQCCSACLCLPLPQSTGPRHAGPWQP